MQRRRQRHWKRLSKQLPRNFSLRTICPIWTNKSGGEFVGTTFKFRHSSLCSILGDPREDSRGERQIKRAKSVRAKVSPVLRAPRHDYIPPPFLGLRGCRGFTFFMTTQVLVILHCFANMKARIARNCTTDLFALLLEPFVLWRSRCRRICVRSLKQPRQRRRQARYSWIRSSITTHTRKENKRLCTCATHFYPFLSPLPSFAKTTTWNDQISSKC